MEVIDTLYSNFGAGDYIGEPVTQRAHMLQCAYFAARRCPDDVELQLACLLHDTGHLLGLRALALGRATQAHGERGAVAGSGALTAQPAAAAEKGTGGCGADAARPWARPGAGTAPVEEPSEVAALLDGVVRAADEEGVIGLMADVGVADHERLGQLFCRAVGLPEPVGLLVREHVNAKRYLCALKPQYFGRLSAASVTTLGFQGGPMPLKEALAFEARYNATPADGDDDFDFDGSHVQGPSEEPRDEMVPRALAGPSEGTLLQRIVRMRQFDEMGKCKGMEVPDLDAWAPTVQRLTVGRVAGIAC